MGHRAYHLKVQSLRKCDRRGRQATSGVYSVSVRLKVFMGKSCIKIGGEGIVTQGEFLVRFWWQAGSVTGGAPCEKYTAAPGTQHYIATA
jgi:hypothetical protein